MKVVQSAIIYILYYYYIEGRPVSYLYYIIIILKVVQSAIAAERSEVKLEAVEAELPELRWQLAYEREQRESLMQLTSELEATQMEKGATTHSEKRGSHVDAPLANGGGVREGRPIKRRSKALTAAHAEIRALKERLAAYEPLSAHSATPSDADGQGGHADGQGGHADGQGGHTDGQGGYTQRNGRRRRSKTPAGTPSQGGNARSARAASPKSQVEAELDRRIASLEAELNEGGADSEMHAAARVMGMIQEAAAAAEASPTDAP